MNFYLRLAGIFFVAAILTINSPFSLRAEEGLLKGKAWVGEIASVFDSYESGAIPAGERTAFLENYKESFSKLYDAGNRLAGLFLESIEDDPAKKQGWAEKNLAGQSGELLKRLAEDNNAEAQLWLGLFYRQGAGAWPRNEEEGNKWLKKAAENGNHQAFEAAFFPMMVNQPDKAWPWVEELAVNGSVPAIRVLADQYYQMLVQAQSLGQPMKEGSPQAREIVKWQMLAADKGSLQANINLYHMYNDGLAVEKNEAQAVLWLKKAADKGDLGAQLTMGLMYFGGSAAEKDMDKIIEYYRPKAEAGQNEARFFLGAAYAVKAGQGGDLNEAAAWLEKAYENGEQRAAFVLGRAYIYAAGTKGDASETESGREKAKIWLTRAYEAGIAEAGPLLAYLSRR